jgi:hypothetical protein
MGVGHGLEAAYHLASAIGPNDLDIKSGVVSTDRNDVERDRIYMYRLTLSGPGRGELASEANHASLTLPRRDLSSRQLMPPVLG